MPQVTPPQLSLFEALVTSDTSSLSIMEECSEEELASNLRFVCDMLAATPLWLDWHRRMAMQILNERSLTSKFLRQRIHYAQLADDDPASFLHHIVPLKDSIHVFREFFAQKRKVGFEVRIPTQASVFHPFKAHTLQRVRVHKVMNSNSRPLVLRMWPKSGEPGTVQEYSQFMS